MFTCFDRSRPFFVRINLSAEVGIVVAGCEYEGTLDPEVVGHLVDVASRIPELRHDLANEQAGSGQVGLTATSGPGTKPDQRMPRQPQGLPEQLLDEAVAGLIRCRGKRVK